MKQLLYFKQTGEDRFNFLSLFQPWASHKNFWLFLDMGLSQHQRFINSPAQQSGLAVKYDLSTRGRSEIQVGSMNILWCTFMYYFQGLQQSQKGLVWKSMRAFWSCSPQWGKSIQILGAAVAQWWSGCFSIRRPRVWSQVLSPSRQTVLGKTSPQDWD